MNANRVLGFYEHFYSGVQGHDQIMWQIVPVSCVLKEEPCWDLRWLFWSTTFPRFFAYLHLHHTWDIRDVSKCKICKKLLICIGHKKDREKRLLLAFSKSHTFSNPSSAQLPNTEALSGHHWTAQQQLSASKTPSWLNWTICRLLGTQEKATKKFGTSNHLICSRGSQLQHQNLMLKGKRGNSTTYFLKPEEEQLGKMPQDSKDTKRLQVVPEHTKQQQCDPQTAQ